MPLLVRYEEIHKKDNLGCQRGARIVRMPRSLNVKDNWQQTLQTTVTSKRMVVSLPLQGIISIT